MSQLQQLEAWAQTCIHCGLCLPACPTYAELGSEADSPRGRIYLMRAYLEGLVSPTRDVTAPLDRCLNCRACEAICPSGVRYGLLLEGVRARMRSCRKTTPKAALRAVLERHVFANRRVFALAIWPLRLLARGDRHWLPQFLAHAVATLPPLDRFQVDQRLSEPTGDGAERTGPLDAHPRSRWHTSLGRKPVSGQPESGLVHQDPLPERILAKSTWRGRAGFLQGCVMPALYPEVNAATVRLLAAVGFEVLIPAQAGCCGAVAAHGGDPARASLQQEALQSEFAPCEIVVTNAGGCGAALKECGRPLAAKVKDLSEVLIECGWQPRRGSQASVAKRVVYHDPCHLAHVQGVKQAPRTLLLRAGFEIIEVPERDLCCGGAGSYALAEPEMSARLMRRKAEILLGANPDLIVSANPSCLMQLRAGLRSLGCELPVQHLAQVLDACS